MRTKIILTQLGSPDSPEVPDVRIYLKRFLTSRRVVDLPRFFWFIILYLIILPFRSPKSAAKYRKIWDGNSFPLVKYSNEFAEGVNCHLQKKFGSKVKVTSTFILPHNGFQNILISGEKERLVIVPMFPQFAESTSMLVLDAFFSAYSKKSSVPDFEFVSSFFDSNQFIKSCVQRIRESIDKNEIDHLLLSFHGIPMSRVTNKGDPYLTQCQGTFAAIKRELVSHTIFKESSITICFQSRFGLSKWLGPATESEALRLISSGKKNIALFSPSFVVDCLETLEELGMDLKEKVEAEGGKIFLIPALNKRPYWIENFSTFLSSYIS